MVCVVLETATVGEGCVVCGVSGLLGVPEPVWTRGVPVTPVVVFIEISIVGSDADRSPSREEGLERCEVEVHPVGKEL